MMRALMRVAAEIARSGDMPMSTCTLISRQSASVWKFIGVPESVPIPMHRAGLDELLDAALAEDTIARSVAAK